MITDQWKAFGKAIAQHADELEQIYYNLDGEVDFQKITNSWQFLAEHGFVYGNPHSGYSASSMLLQLGDILTLTENRQVQAPDIDEWQKSLKRLISRYHIAKKENDQTDLLATKREIHTNVLIMQNTLEAEIRQLEYFVDNKFGHVNSLKAKQQENEYCIEKAGRSAAKLTLINDAEISRLCGNDLELMKVFLRKLLPSVKRSRERLLAIIPRLKNILWEYRRINQRTHLVQAVHNYVQAGRSISGDELSEQHLAASPFNLAAGMLIISHADTTSNNFRSPLVDVVKSMRAKKYTISVEEEIDLDEHRIIDKEDKKVAALPEPLLRPFLHQFIKAFKQEPQSARGFWLAQPEQIVPVGIWIGWLHQELQKSNSSRLSISPRIKSEASYSANCIISDLTVSYQVKSSESI